MLAKTLVAASTRPMVLAILRSGENYGYKIIQCVKKISGGCLDWSEPMLYPLLKRMEREGLVKSRWKLLDNKKPRKYYQLTEKGFKQQVLEQDQWFQISSIFRKLLDTELLMETQ